MARKTLAFCDCQTMSEKPFSRIPMNVILSLELVHHWVLQDRNDLTSRRMALKKKNVSAYSCDMYYKYKCDLNIIVAVNILNVQKWEIISGCHCNFFTMCFRIISRNYILALLGFYWLTFILYRNCFWKLSSHQIAFIRNRVTLMYYP